MFARIVSVSAFVLVAACGGSTSAKDDASGNGNGALQAAGDGVGSTLGGCPESEAADGASCSDAGRACHWKRSDGARATGWCTAQNKWRIVVGPAAPCPETPATHQAAGGGAPNDPNAPPEPPPTPECTPGLTCVYPSTPFGGALSCTCSATGFWNSLCSSVDDGWKDSPSAPGATGCGELASCGGASGCGTACYGTVSPGPNGTSSSPAGQTSKTCGCGEDGLMYCAISSCGGG